MSKLVVKLNVNGRPAEKLVEARMTLADFLREELGLTGTKLGCEHGVCGACTVLVDGEAVRSCLLFAVQIDGGDVRTVEGLGNNGHLHAVQQAFTDHHALQCGFCTPGFLMSVYGYLKHHPVPQDDEELRIALAGNICRCTGYQGIVNAVKSLSGREI